MNEHRFIGCPTAGEFPLSMRCGTSRAVVNVLVIHRRSRPPNPALNRGAEQRRFARCSVPVAPRATAPG